MNSAVELTEQNIQVTPGLMRRAIVAGSVGSIMEWYDFGIFGYFSSVISSRFFPSKDPVAALLSTFAVFMIGFIMRPLGAIVLGAYGDRVGRQKALVLSVMLMAIGTVIMSIIPAYGQIGWWAPFFLVIARLVQGFSVGGEFTTSASFLVEYSPSGKRGFNGSWSQVASGSGLLLASIIATVLSSSMSTTSLSSWGWRLAFALGIIVAIFGLYIRTKVDETPVYQKAALEKEISKSPLGEVLTKHPLKILRIIGLSICWTSAFYISLTYMPTYIKTVVHLSFTQAMLSNIFVNVIFLVLIPIMGKLSDKVGRKPMLLTSCIGFLVLSYPVFFLVNKGSLIMAFLPQVILAVFLAMFSGTAPAAFAEILPTRIRNTTLSVGYNVASALFGGTAPFIATYLIHTTNNKFSPTYYVMICAVITLLVLLTTKDRSKSQQI